LCTSIPAILYGIGLSCGSGERASSHQSGSQAVVGRQDATMPNYSVNRARSGSHSCSASIAPWFISISPLPTTHSVQSQRFSFLFAGLEAQPHPVAKIVQCGELGGARVFQASPIRQAHEGGHFAAWEQPDLFSTEHRNAFRSLR
jgi:hypothetical protein